MATEGPISTLEHISNEQNGLQESANADSHIPDINDASALHKAADDAQETGSQDTVSRSASEEIARTSIDSAAEKTQLPRPYEPIAKTLEADKEYTPHPESIPEAATPVEHEVVLNGAHVIPEEAPPTSTATDAEAPVELDEAHESAPEPEPEVVEHAAEEDNTLETPSTEPEVVDTPAETPVDPVAEHAIAAEEEVAHEEPEVVDASAETPVAEAAAAHEEVPANHIDSIFTEPDAPASEAEAPPAEITSSETHVEEETPAAEVEPVAVAEEAEAPPAEITFSETHVEEETPVADVEPAAVAEDTPVAEVEPVAVAEEVEAPPAKITPSETHVEEETPVAEVEPVAIAEEAEASPAEITPSETHVEEETPVAEVEPAAAVEDTPVAEVEPVAAAEEETPVTEVEHVAAVEETPVAEVEPAAVAEEEEAPVAAAEPVTVAEEASVAEVQPTAVAEETHGAAVQPITVAEEQEETPIAEVEPVAVAAEEEETSELNESVEPAALEEAAPAETVSEAPHVNEEAPIPEAAEPEQHEATPAEADVGAVAAADSEVPNEEDQVLETAHPHEVPEEAQDAVAEVAAVADETIAEPEAVEEAPIVHDAVEESADQLSVKTSEEIERPKSPWMPSYSVTTQGSAETAAETPEDAEEATPAVPEVVLDCADVEPETTEAEVTAVEEAQAPEAVEHDLPASATPDIVFDHVDAVEPASFEVEAAAVEEAPDSAAGSIHAPESIHALEPTSKSPSVLALDTTSLHSGDEETKEERPKSPWTPSYSVVSQGTVANDAKELDELDQLPPSVTVETPEAVLASEPVAESLTLESSEAAEVAQSPNIPSIDITSSEEPEETPAVTQDTDTDEVPVPKSPSQLSVGASAPVQQSEEERPKSPWTPSYSVINQGTVSQDATEIEQLEQLPSAVEVEQPTSHVEAVPDAVIVVDAAPELEQVAPVPSIDVTESAEVQEHSSTHHIPIAFKSSSQASTSPPAASPAAEEDRPKSPWTPSYSVINQGSASPDAAEIEQLEQLPPAVEAAPDAAPEKDTAPELEHVSPVPSIDVTESAEVQEHSSTHHIPIAFKSSSPVSTEEERPKSPWTPSYSVSNQGAAEIEQLEQLPPAIEPSSHEEVSPLPSIDVSQSPDVQENSFTHEIPGTSSPQEAIVSKSPSQLSINLPAEEERPKSPWTPSYSVSRQGSVSKDAADLEELEQLPPPKSPWTPSYSVSRQGSVGPDAAELDELEQLSPPAESGERSASPAHDVELKPASIAAPTESLIEEPKAEVPDDDALVIPEITIPDRPASPWTPSYAVTTQGPDEAVKAEDAETEPSQVQDLPQKEVFPATVDADAQEAAKKPSLPHLTTSDALNVPEDPVESAPRKRTESAISRFFPGGWFTSSPTVPDVIKTRTSTDVATGEFIRSASQDSAQSEPAVTPVVSPGDEETKSRWCTIM